LRKASAVQVLSGLWTAIGAAANTVQAALDSVDQLLSGHFAAPPTGTKPKT